MKADRKSVGSSFSAALKTERGRWVTTALLLKRFSH